ncbi:HNH endonuclease [Pseudarthrobacter sulfonivorans]|uniref:HNH endonuclease n=1 Tax=Pseudarthrobacter sulfonivorans TaxID=121292 RepID=UPI0035A8D4CA
MVILHQPRVAAHQSNSFSPMAGESTGHITHRHLPMEESPEARTPSRQAQGIERCPYCKVKLDYLMSRTPASAEPDHVYAHANDGQDPLDNLQVCCRKCNQSKGNRPAPKPRPF